MYLIGLTGNIASGKSTVRLMLEQLGARTIDADSLAHLVIRSGGPAYRAVSEAFGQKILSPNGEIDRKMLGALVFGDRIKLQELEAIIHPAVSKELARLLREAQEPIVVIEAVKLIEAGLDSYCDAVWIVTTPVAEAKRRLVVERGTEEIDAQLRLRSQPAIEDKLKRASVIIDNSGSLESTRNQVDRAFSLIDPGSASNKARLYSDLI